ncbi:MAG: zeta toxin family protein [Acidimicrobiales bacterium]
MADPVLHVIAGPNGAGKTTFFARVLEPVTRLEFLNADVIAVDGWGDDAAAHAYEAADIAAAERVVRIRARRSFATETVFSHASKIEMLARAEAAGYRVNLHIILVPEQLAVARVMNRVENGGHAVAEDKVLARFGRLWSHLRDAIGLVDEARVYDNTRAADPFRLVATFIDGKAIGSPEWPSWSPEELRQAGR